jgi:pyrroloquinoline quinone biosynthesis protein D
MNSYAPSDRPRLERHVHLQIDTVSSNPVLLLPETVVVLNQTGCEILRLCGGSRTVSEIIQALANKYPAAGPIVSQEVSEYLRAGCQPERANRVEIAECPYALLAELTYHCPLHWPYC